MRRLRVDPFSKFGKAEVDPAYEPTDANWKPPRGWQGNRIIWPFVLLATIGTIVLLVAVRAALNGEAMRGRVKAKVEQLLEERVGGARVGDHYEVDWLGRVSLGPIAIVGSEPSKMAVGVQSVVVSPRWRALFAGRAEASWLMLRGVRVNAGLHGSELAAVVDRIRERRRDQPAAAPGAPAHAKAPLPTLRFEDAILRMERRAKREDEPDPPPVEIVLDRGEVEIVRSGTLTTVDADVRLPGGGRATAALRYVRGGPLSFRAHLSDLHSDALPASMRASLPGAITSGTLSADVQTESPEGFERGTLTVAANLRKLTLAGPMLAEEPIGPMRIDFAGTLRWDRAQRRVWLEDARVAVGDKGQARLNLTARLLLKGDPSFTVGARIEQIDYQAALDALPPALVPGPGTPRLDGVMSAAFSLAGPLRKPQQWELGADLDLSGLKEAAKQRAPIFLKGPFLYKPVDGEGREREIVVGPQNKHFVPLAELPPYVYRAVTTSEDAAFFAHHGFDFEEMKNSFVADAEAGRAVRGGSTISQQLAKNLFLSREKTYARKIKEALVTVALEASLTKQRMLEIYLNIIEWGPGVNGLGEAARHYFGKDPRRLTPKEAAFLATIIPNPVKFHFLYERGALTEAWERRVTDLLVKMREANVIDDLQLQTALRTPLVFARG